jgi:hypothetical protein
MKAKIDGIEVEGEPSELVGFLKALQSMVHVGVKVDVNGSSTSIYKIKRANRCHPSWTEADNRLLWSLFTKNTPYELIAQKLNRSADACKAKMYALKQASHTKKLLGGEKIVSKRYPSKHKPWTEEEKSFLKKESSIGIPIRSIARKLGRTSGAVGVMKSVLKAAYGKKIEEVVSNGSS